MNRHDIRLFAHAHHLPVRLIQSLLQRGHLRERARLSVARVLQERENSVHDLLRAFLGSLPDHFLVLYATLAAEDMPQMGLQVLSSHTLAFASWTFAAHARQIDECLELRLQLLLRRAIKGRERGGKLMVALPKGELVELERRVLDVLLIDLRPSIPPCLLLP